MFHNLISMFWLSIIIGLSLASAVVPYTILDPCQAWCFRCIWNVLVSNFTPLTFICVGPPIDAIGVTVEPLSNDHPHQRPSLLYDHILCDGHCFLFVRSLTNDHPSDVTNDRVRWDFLPRERPPRLQCSSKDRGWRFNIRSQSCIITMLCLDTFQVIQLIWTSFILATTLKRHSQIDVASLRCCQPAGAQTHLY